MAYLKLDVRERLLNLIIHLLDLSASSEDFQVNAPY